MITPYANETETYRIDQLTVENREDRVQLYGSLDITRDKKGLAHAKELLNLIEKVVKTLEGDSLPEQVELRTPNTVANPFD